MAKKKVTPKRTPPPTGDMEAASEIAAPTTQFRHFYSGTELDAIRAADKGNYDDICTELGRRYQGLLERRLRSSTEYPADTIREFRMTIKAIETGKWWPPGGERGPWRPPKQRSAYEKFMAS